MRRLLAMVKWLLITVVRVPLLWFMVCWTLYRMPLWNADTTYVGAIHYKFIEIDLSNRGIFESLCGNTLVRLEGQPELYIPDSDMQRLWAESPHDMRVKGYTYRVQVTAARLLSGGIGVGQVGPLERLQQAPHISK